MEVLHDLVGYKNLKIYQNTSWFLFSLDSVLLANFVTLNKNVKTIIDLGTGNAPIPLILSTRTKAKIIGVEIQQDLCDLALKSVCYNHLQEQISIFNYDIRNLQDKFLINSIDTITVNPPYFKVVDSSYMNGDIHKTIARHEYMVTLEDIIRVSSVLLRQGGNLAIVHRAERFIDLVMLFRKYHIEPKRVQFVYPKVLKDANMVLIEGRKGASMGVKILSPLYVHKDSGKYTEEVLKYFS